MARIELRNTSIKIKDGLSGTGLINDMSVMSGDTTMSVGTIVLNTTDTDKVPVGARFTVEGETAATTVHVVTVSTGTPTTAITFSPALTTGTYTNGNDLTFYPQELEIKIGEGELKYTETTNYIYDLDRGNLDTVRQGDEAPMDISLSFTYEHITTGTNEAIAPMDAIKRIGNATDWVSSSEDLCEPYAVDIEVLHTPPCGTNETETTVFPDFRADKKDVSFKDALITISGKCNATQPLVERN